MVDDLEFGAKGKRTKVGGLPEVDGVGEDYIMIGESELNIVLIDGEDVAKSRRV